MAVSLYKVRRKVADQEKSVSVRLDPDGSLAAVRDKLGAFMKEGDRFMFEGAEIDPADEPDTKLSEIVNGKNSFELANSDEEGADKKAKEDAAQARAKDDQEKKDAEDAASAEEKAADGLKQLEKEQKAEREKRGEKIDPTKYDTGDEKPKPDLEKRDREEDKLLEGIGAGGRTKDMEQVNGLNHKQRDTLLIRNHVDVSRRTAAAWVMSADGQLDWAREHGVSFTNVKLMSPAGTRTDHTTYSYTSHDSQWQKQTVGAGTAGLGVPLIFQAMGSYKNVTDRAKFDKRVRVYMQSSQLVPKARMTLDGFSLSEAFVDKVRQVTKKFDNDFNAASFIGTDTGGIVAKAASDLLDVLETYGQFVAKETLLGGRITLFSERELRETDTFESVLHDFRLAVDARLTADGIPLDVGGGSRFTSSEQSRITAIQEAKRLHMQLKGGDPAPASSRAGELGAKWIKTLAKHDSWEAVGFYEHALIPTVDLLEPKLKSTCKEILKQYFTRQLREKHTDIVGDTGSEPFRDSAVSNVRCIKQVIIRWAREMDSIALQIKLNNGQLAFTPTHGNPGMPTGPAARQADFKLAEDEEIAAMTVGVGNRVKYLIFWTTKDNRCPPSGYYGPPGLKCEEITVSASRVRGLTGHSGGLLDAIGLVYLELDEKTTMSRQFLSAMEPYLFD